MEQRWGERVAVGLPVRVMVHAYSMVYGRLVDMSVSGAYLQIALNVRLLSRVGVTIEVPHTLRCAAPSLAAYITRLDKGFVGIEWCEFSPPLVSDLLESLVGRRYTRRRNLHSDAAAANPRYSRALLRHGV